MTIQFLAANIITGLSTDTKPTSVPTDTRFFETDTRRWFRFDGTDYLEIGYPRADNEIFVYSQTDLEDALGTNIEIPDGESRSITVKVDTLVIAKPIKLGVGSSLFLSSDTILRTLVYTGSGAMIQETTPGSGAANIVINQIIIAGITTNEFIDVTIGASNLVQINNTFIFSMALGNVGGGVFEAKSVRFTDYSSGFIFDENPFGVFFNDCGFVNLTGTNTTAITIKTTLNSLPQIISTDGGFPAGNFLIFYDPNSGVNGRLIVNNCVAPTNQLFQPGAIQVNSAVIGTSGAGFTNFTTATSHGLIVGDTIVNSTFADSAYNGTFIVISVDTPLTGTIYEVEATFTATGTGQLFHQNADITINSVADNGSGNTRFTTAGAHGLVVGQAVVIKDFVTQTTYNQTAIVTAVDTPKTGVTFDADIVFVATDTGTINAASLDQTDPKVTATNNPNNTGSMTAAEARTGATLTVDGSGGVAVPIVDLTPTAGDWIEDPATERFTIDTSTGLITYDGLETVNVEIKYQLTVAQSGGAAQTVNIDTRVNGVAQTKSTITIITSAGGVTGSYIGGIFVLNSGDTIQLFKDNTTNTTDTNISNVTVLLTSQSS